MATPLYKNLKNQGTSIYAFPGADEDNNFDTQNPNYNMSFSKFVLINLPVVQTEKTDEPVIWDFEDAFYSASTSPATTYSDRMINSLRNYVANQETTIRETQTGDNEYFYNNEILQTSSEKLFFKWCKKLNLIQFEPAVDGDEYFGNLAEFESGDESDDEYFPEFLWKEREVSENNVDRFYETTESGFTAQIEVEYQGTINYKVDDWIEFSDVGNTNFPGIAKYAQVDKVIVPSGSLGYRVVFDITYTGNPEVESVRYSKLVYNKLVRYIGEVQGNNNVILQNQAYNQIIASIGDNAGETPDILFRTNFDDNYAPDLQYPILPVQYQPEIIGAENFNSPIVQNPQNYPGDQYAQYDNDDATDEYTYLNTTGDTLRRSGDYFGVSGDVNNATFDGSDVDGIMLDFDTSHYVKMNIVNEEKNNFDEFNISVVNGEFPSDFQFNAILWYYDVSDVNGNTASNLYGVSFVDHPDNHLVYTGEQIPQFTKLVNDGTQDGTSYQFSLNLNRSISTDQPQPTYTNQPINDLFGFALYNEAMRGLAVNNDYMNTAISEHSTIIDEIEQLKQLIYTQTDIDTINKQINHLNSLLTLYSTNQIVTTNSIKVVNDNSTSPPEIQLFNIEGRYAQIGNVNTTTLYDEDGYIPYSVAVPEGKDFLVRVSNNDTTTQTLLDDQRLTIFLNQDLYYRQTIDIVVDGVSTSTENKQLDILITYSDDPSNVPILRTAVGNLDLPVFYNQNTQDSNTSYNWEQISESVTQFKLNDDGETIGTTCSRVLGLVKGDTIKLSNVLFGADNTSVISIDGQYVIDSIDSGGTTINLDYTQNSNLNSYIDQEIADGNLSSGDIMSEYNSIGRFNFNKGWKISITRVDSSDTSTFENRYLITTSPR